LLIFSTDKTLRKKFEVILTEKLKMKSLKIKKGGNEPSPEKPALA